MTPVKPIMSAFSRWLSEESRSRHTSRQSLRSRSVAASTTPYVLVRVWRRPSRRLQPFPCAVRLALNLFPLHVRQHVATPFFSRAPFSRPAGGNLPARQVATIFIPSSGGPRIYFERRRASTGLPRVHLDEVATPWTRCAPSASRQRIAHATCAPVSCRRFDVSANDLPPFSSGAV